MSDQEFVDASSPEQILEPIMPDNVVYTSTGDLAHLPEQVRRAAKRHGADFTLMVVGESGVGKKSFINTLFGDTVTSVFPTSNQPSVPGSTNLEVCQAVYDEDGVEGRFTVVFTKGYGDYTSNAYAWAPVTSYMDAQLQAYMLQEEQPDRRGITDTRVHACVYMIPPTGHGLCALDIAAMTAIGQRANLLPVIAKADAFTAEGLAAFKASIRAAVVREDIAVFAPQPPPGDADMARGPALDSSADNEARAGVSAGAAGGAGAAGAAREASEAREAGPAREATPADSARGGGISRGEFGGAAACPVACAQVLPPSWPPAIVTSTSTVPAPGSRVVRGRSYRWGVAEVENPAHSDFARLRSVLLAEHMLDLVAATHDVHYRAHREQVMRARLIAAQTLAIESRPASNLDSCSHSASGGTGTRLGMDSGSATSVASAGSTASPTGAWRDADLDDLIRAGNWDALSSIEVLGVLQPFGREYLAMKLLDANRLYERRVRRIQDEFAVVAQFQEERFKAWHADLCGYKAAFEAELADLMRANQALEHDIQRLDKPRSRLIS